MDSPLKGEAFQRAISESITHNIAAIRIMDERKALPWWRIRERRRLYDEGYVMASIGSAWNRYLFGNGPKPGQDTSI